MKFSRAFSSCPTALHPQLPNLTLFHLDFSLYPFVIIEKTNICLILCCRQSTFSFLGHIVSCELKFDSQSNALITPENRYMGSASSSVKEGWGRRLFRIISHASRNTGRNYLILTLPPDIALTHLLLDCRVFCRPNHEKEREEVGCQPGAAHECALCSRKVLTRAERTLSWERGEGRG